MRIPRHIGVIPDGNRRWATLRQMEKKDGYQYGLEPGMKLLKKAKEYGVEELTYYGFTTDNCKRPKEQFEAFQSACVEAVQMLTREGADLLVIGNEKSKCFPKELEHFRVRTPASQYKVDYAFRGYATLTKDGRDITIYGPTVAKNIYSLAEQLLQIKIYEEGSDADLYLRKLIQDADKQ